LLAAGASSARRRTGMQGPLGEKIGEGAFSEAYAWAPGQVVKLFKAGVSHQLGRHEVRMIRAVLAAGLPVPEVFGEVTLDGRSASCCSGSTDRPCGSSRGPAR
jgi:hypothetical protein